MRFKKGKRVLALVMAVLMVVGLMPFTNLGTAKAAETKTYKFDATTLTAAADKEALTGTVADGFVTVFGTVTKRTSSSGSVASTEVDKNNGGGYSFTITGTATFKVDVSSTGSTNESRFHLTDAEGKDVADVTGTTEISVTGSSNGRKTVTYELSAGTYKFQSVEWEYEPGKSRGGRVYSIEIEETENTPVVTTKYAFDATTLTAAADKEALTGTVADGFVTVFGTVTKRTSSSGSVASTEVDKNNGGGYSFTITGTATFKVDVSSTGSTNESRFHLTDAEGKDVADVTGTTEISVTGSSNGRKTVTYELSAGTYKFQSVEWEYEPGKSRGGRVYSFEIEETTGGSRPERKAWAEVAAPAIGTVSVNGSKAVVPYTMEIGYDGADSVTVVMKDASGAVVATQTGTDTDGSVEFTLSASGDYTFSISAQRRNEDDKAGTDAELKGFVYPLAKSAITLLNNKGNGTASLEWSAVKEATSYEVEYSADGTTWSKANATDKLTAEVSGLTVGAEYSFRVVAKRGDEATTSDAVKLKITSEAQQAWGYIAYGNGASQTNGKVEGSVNEDGQVTMSAGKWTFNEKDGTWSASSNNGKWVPASYDGLGFYYTTVPASMNFTLRAKVTVNEWFLSNAQEAFGLIANDKLGGSGWNNSYSAYISKNEYFWNAAESEVTTDTSAQKVTQKLGIGAQEKIGITKDNIGKIEGNDSATIQSDFKASTYPLEQRYPDAANIIGNGVNTTADPSITEVYLSIQKNNTGYFVTYESVDGSYKMTKKYYDTKALEQLDSENVYVGFFLARYGNVTFSDITFTTIDPKDDAPAEERPVEKIAVNTSIESPTATGVKSYEFAFSANCDGALTIYDANNKVIAENVAVKANNTVKPATTELSIGKNNYKFVFTPDANYVPGEYQVMESYEPIEIKHTVSYAVYGKSGESIWVAPDAKGNGTKANPMSIYDAVKYVQPGQTIVLMGGKYNLEKTVKVERGIDGTADKKIYMVADPDATERPVLDFGGICAGMVLAGDYWVFRGFDVTNSADAQKGIQVSGNYNLLDSINAYRNGNTGIQISRYLTTDGYENWPAYNTILNCTSYGNADKGFEDADGFAAKLTVGDGNVFDGCIAHHNADDGWDLFAKVQSGRIGSVTIKNSVAYANGYTEAGGEAGNGNGFKMGGDSMSGKHVLQNCVSYDNKAKGIDSNSCPDIIVKDCVTYNNGSYNVAFYTNTATNTDFSADNVISFRTQKTDIAEQFKFVGNQDTSKVYKDTNYFWDAAAGKSLNKSGVEATADWFESLDTSVVPARNADGTINMHGLLKVTDKAPEVMRNAGLTVSTASEATVIPPSISAEDIKTGDTTPIALYVILAIASMAVLAGAAFVGKKRLSK